MESPLISVVIPCFNQGVFLSETINSVLQSTYQNFEIILVNDGSTDQTTIEVLSSISHEKIRVIHQVNQGVAAARNTGFRAARGAFFLPLDSDDMIAPTMLEETAALLQSHPDIAYAYTDVRYFGDENFISIACEYNLYKMLWFGQNAHCALLRREAFEDIGGYTLSKDVDGYEDLEFWIHLGLRGWYGKRIPKPLFYYRRHGVTRYHIALARHAHIMKHIADLHPETYHSKQALLDLRKQWMQEGLLDQFVFFLRRLSYSRFFPVFLRDFAIKLRDKTSLRRRVVCENPLRA